MEQYFNAYFIINKLSVILSPYLKNQNMNRYLINNSYDNFMIITAYVSNEINKIEENKKKNKLLKKDIKTYKYFKCYGADKIINYKHREDSFIVFNISKQYSLELCEKYKQDCILWGEKNKFPILLDRFGNDLADIKIV